MNGVELRLLTMEPGITVLVNGEEHRLSKPREQLILAILLLAEGKPVSADTIIDRLWAENPPASARVTLHSYVSRLRAGLTAIGAESIRIVTRSGTYRLEIRPEAVDLFRFRQRVHQAEAMAQTGDLEHAVRLLREAERLWPGDALIGFGNAWARARAEELAAERLAALGRRIDLELSLGRHADVLPELRRLVAAHPLDESLAGRLMTALYRCGRSTDALRFYQSVRERMRDEYGLEPSHALEEVYLRILRQDGVLAVTPVYRRGDSEPQPNTLGEDVPHFVGREREIRLLDVVRTHRPGPGVVVIEGMPGVGKTALAVHVAHRMAARFPDALLKVNMRGHDGVAPPRDPAEVASELLRALGVPAARVPASPHKRFEMWREALARRRAVVILDDATGPDQVRPLLPHSWPGLMLITTRGRFEPLPGVRRVPLNVLPDHDALRLCTSLAPPGTAPETIGEATRLCGGLPLAITLMAPHLGAARPRALDGLAGGPAGRLARDANEHVHRAFELSYRDLRPAARLAFRRLGLHPCADFTAEVCAVLTGTSRDRAEAAIGELCDHHLLRETGHGRFGFHDLIREYARELAWREDPRAENRMAVRRLLDHYLRAVENADRAAYPYRWRGVRDSPFDPPGRLRAAPAQARRWLAEEWRNVLALAAYAGEHEWRARSARLVHLLAAFLDEEGYREEAIAAQKRALHACNVLGEQADIARASLDLGRTCLKTANHADARWHTRVALRYYRAAGDPHGEAKARDQLGLISWGEDDFEQAAAMLEEAQAVCHSIGDLQGEAIILDHRAMACWYVGQNAEARRLYGMALEKCRLVGDRQTEARILNNLAHVEQSRGRHREALELLRRCSEICDEIFEPRPHAVINHNRGDLCCYKGRYEQALEHYRSALTAYRERGDRRNEAEVLIGIGNAYLLLDRPDEALVHFERARDIAEEVRITSLQAAALDGIANVDRDSGRYLAALSGYQSAAELARSIGDQRNQARIHDHMGDTYRYLGQAENARLHWRQAASAYRRLDMREAEQRVRMKFDPLGEAAS
jgi:DNA-binding SARP family transcriptional activator/predicted negative regulator of RcsB-dependent stress response